MRPEPGASASALRAKAAGFEPMLMPLFAVKPRSWVAPDPSGYDALLITSANAIRHAGPQLQALSKLPVCAVGENSAAAAREAGLTVALSGDSDADATIAAAASAGYSRLIWLVGAEHMQPALPDGLTLETIICYTSEEQPLPAQGANSILQADIVALHSPRAARLFANIVDQLGLDRAAIALAAFSPAIAEAAGTGWRAIAIAARPADSALLSAAAELVKQFGFTRHGRDIG